jgi:mannose-6-phosphate isomerase-like protein (cupin superfamily)
MHRRSFLQAAAAALPALGLHDLLAETAACQSPEPAPAPLSLHVVADGEDRFGSPHSLGFSTVAFKVGTAETGGGLFVIEHTHLVPGGPALHLHLSQEEWFYVMGGQVAFQVGEQRITLSPGESVLAPRRVPHTFSSVAQTSRLLIAFTPAGKMEAYMRDSEKAGPPADPAAWFRKYDMEYLGPSPFWKTQAGQLAFSQIDAQG